MPELIATLERFFSNLAAITLEAAPWLLLGLLAAGLLKSFVPMHALSRWLGGRGVGPVFKAAVIGTPIPLCSCGVLPAAIGLHRSGASKGATASFLVATPENGVDSLALTYALLGPWMTIARPVAAILSSLGAGMFVQALERDDRARDTTNTPPTDSQSSACCGSADDASAQPPAPSCCSSPAQSAASVKSCCGSGDISLTIAQPDMTPGVTGTTPPTPQAAGTMRQRLRVGLGFAFTDILRDIAIWMIIGLALAAAIVTAVPPDAMSAWGSGIVAMLLVLLVSMPMYICATASTPIAAGLLVAGMSPGTILVFLLAGPATNIASLIVLKREMGLRWVVGYLSAVCIGAIVFGLALDAILSLTPLTITANAGEARHFMPTWIGPVSVAILGFAVLRLGIGFGLGSDNKQCAADEPATGAQEPKLAQSRANVSDG